MKPDATYFSIGLTLVPNQSQVIGGVTKTSATEELTKYIDRYSAEFMKLLLGSLYTDYVANPTDAKWVALDAKLYDTTLKISPVANYVFFQYYNQSTRRNTPTGVSVAMVENASIVTHGRLVEVWNEMVRMMNAWDGPLALICDDMTTYPVVGSEIDWTNFVHTINDFGL